MKILQTNAYLLFLIVSQVIAHTQSSTTMSDSQNEPPSRIIRKRNHTEVDDSNILPENAQKKRKTSKKQKKIGEYCRIVIPI